jgi:hypothetical protein
MWERPKANLPQFAQDAGSGDTPESTDLCRILSAIRTIRKCSIPLLRGASGGLLDPVG